MRVARRLLVLLALVVTLAGCAQQEQERFAPKWIGKYPGELIAALGQPTSTTNLLETGGEIWVYANPNQPHYVFEI